LVDLLARRYDVVAANPPYMGTRRQGPALFTQLENSYPKFREDLYAAFIARAIKLCKNDGLIAFVCQQGIFFTDAYKEGRRAIRSAVVMRTLVRIGPGGFEEITGEVVNTVMFCAARAENRDGEGVYVDIDKASGKAAALSDCLRAGGYVRRR